jgi:hypothetical protein
MEATIQKELEKSKGNQKKADFLHPVPALPGMLP